MILIDSLEVYPVLKGLTKVHVVFSQEGHAFPLRDKNFVEITFLGSRDVKVICFGEVLSVIVVKEGDTELE